MLHRSLTFIWSLRHSDGEVGTIVLEGAGVGSAVGSAVGLALAVGEGVGSKAVHSQEHCNVEAEWWYVYQYPLEELGGCVMQR